MSLNSLRDDSKPWLDWLLTASQLAVIIGAISGLFFVFAYLRSVGATLPAADLPAMTSLFLLVAFLFSVLAAFVAGFTSLPMFASLVSPVARDQSAHLNWFQSHFSYYLGMIGVFIATINVPFSVKFTLLSIGVLILSGIAVNIWQFRNSEGGKIVKIIKIHYSQMIGTSIFYLIRTIIGLYWSILVFVVIWRLTSIRVDLAQLSDSKASALIFFILLAIGISYTFLTSISDKNKPRFFVLTSVVLVIFLGVILSASIWCVESSRARYRRGHPGFRITCFGSWHCLRLLTIFIEVLSS